MPRFFGSRQPESLRENSQTLSSRTYIGMAAIRRADFNRRGSLDERFGADPRIAFSGNQEFLSLPQTQRIQCWPSKLVIVSSSVNGVIHVVDKVLLPK